MNSFDEVFFAVKEYCKERVAEATYNVFFDGLSAVSFEGTTAVINVRSIFLRDIVSARYVQLLNDGFKAILGFEVKIEFVTPPDAEEQHISSVSSGKYDFTFSNFIVGSTNKFAHAAAQAVAANPSGAYNPLFIWGDSGLGKTHLLNAIETEIRRNTDLSIVYVSGEQFTNEIIEGIRDNRMNDVHNKYRAADVLLVDDIQFIGGKVSTQEEFFHTFNTLYQSGKQIVLASDRPPREIKSLEDRLRTRFEMGLIADIQPPDFETRVAIIRRKADLLSFDLPDDVAEFIAKHLKTNIRQLEGAVKKLKAYQQLQGIHPSIGAAQNAIKDILSETQPIPVTVEKILVEVSRTYNTTPEEIRGSSRRANISNARKISMYILREITGMSMEDIGKEFGDRDHSTVVYAVNGIADDRLKDDHMREIIDDIIKNIKQ